MAWSAMIVCNLADPILLVSFPKSFILLLHQRSIQIHSRSGHQHYVAVCHSRRCLFRPIVELWKHLNFFFAAISLEDNFLPPYRQSASHILRWTFRKSMTLVNGSWANKRNINYLHFKPCPFTITFPFIFAHKFARSMKLTSSFTT